MGGYGKEEATYEGGGQERERERGPMLREISFSPTGVEFTGPQQPDSVARSPDGRFTTAQISARNFEMTAQIFPMIAPLLDHLLNKRPNEYWACRPRTIPWDLPAAVAHEQTYVSHI